jgi:asparagine synthase (glutamine-hydrolysing)
MTSVLNHRGPDAEGYWISTDQKLALGHRRLSILDLSSAGAQPMISHSGRFVLVLNGEIYNFLELRNELIQLGIKHSWRGHSDTEVLLSAIECWGVKRTLQKAVGMFAFALWDIQEHQLTLVRDRFGEKPLYFAVFPGAVLFGSELKALERHPAFRREPDIGALGLYLQYGYIPGPLSPYKGVQKLLPGNSIEISKKGDTFVSTTTAYWSPQSSLFSGNEPTSSLHDSCNTLLKLLEKAIAGQMLADVPVGAFLSGGVDSSLVVAIMRRVSSAPVRTFTVGFEDKTFDEAPYARKVAKHLGTDHHESYVSTREVLDIIPRLPEIYDEPFGDTSQIPTALVARTARKNVVVCLSGDGGDELFGGYNHYRWGRTLQILGSAVPVVMLRGIGHSLSFLRPLAPPRLRRFLELTAAGKHNAHRELLFNSVFPDISPFGLVFDRNDPIEARILTSGNRGIARLMELDLYGFLPDDILMKVDRATMAVGLESRTPYLDHGVAKFAWSLPLEYRTSRTRGKIVLRELLSRFVPTELSERPKQGFGLPLSEWLRGPLRTWAESVLLQPTAWLDNSAIRLYWDEHQSAKINRQRELWTLISLCIWLRRL